MGQDKLKQAQRAKRQAHRPAAEEQVKADELALTDERAAEALRADPALAARMGPEQRARAVSGLQKTHGNAAVQRMLQRQAVGPAGAEWPEEITKELPSKGVFAGTSSSEEVEIGPEEPFAEEENPFEGLNLNWESFLRMKPASEAPVQRQVEPEEEEEAEEEPVQETSKGKGENRPKGATAGQPYAVASEPREAIPEGPGLLKFPSWLNMPGIEDILQKKPAAGAVQRDWEVGLTPDWWIKKGLDKAKHGIEQLGQGPEAATQTGGALGGALGPVIEDIAGQVKKKPAEGVPAPGPLPADLMGAIDAERGQGQALDEATRAEMETALGADFDDVRVHTGAEADALNRALGAAAFTTGADVFFREGEYQPESKAGRELLAHELTHVAQQGGEASGPLTLGPVDDAFEREADRAAEEVASGKGSESAADTATQPGAVQRGLFDDLLGTARGLVGGGAGAAREAIGAGAGAASSAVGQVGGMASGLLGNLTGMGGGLVSQGAGALGGLLGNLGGRATGAIGNLAGRATEAVSGLPGGGLLGGLIGNLAGMGTSAVERGVGAAGGLVGRGAGMAQNLITGLGGMGERAIGGGTSIAENLIGAGSQEAEGVVGMAERGAGGALDVVEGIANAAENMPEMPLGPMMPQIPETAGAGGIGGMLSELLGRFF